MLFYGRKEEGLASWSDMVPAASAGHAWPNALRFHYGSADEDIIAFLTASYFFLLEIPVNIPVFLFEFPDEH